MTRMPQIFRKPTLEENLRKAGVPKCCNVYMHRDRQEAIIATVFQTIVAYEIREAVYKCAPTHDIPLGEAAIKAFDASEVRELKESERPLKRSTWPSYLASGCPSADQFEREYIKISVSGQEKTKSMARLETEPLQQGIRLTSICNPYQEHVLGTELNKLRKLFVKWEKV